MLFPVWCEHTSAVLKHKKKNQIEDDVYYGDVALLKMFLKTNCGILQYNTSSSLLGSLGVHQARSEGMS